MRSESNCGEPATGPWALGKLEIEGFASGAFSNPLHIDTIIHRCQLIYHPPAIGAAR